MLQPQALASMLGEYEKAYSVIAEKTKTLERFRDEYKDLRNRLKTLPDKIEYDALVPLGTKALVPGKIIHTNEILCMLGDSWFMECSAKTAVEIVDRRIKTCNKHLESQRKEAERLENWRRELTKFILESAEEDSKEIVEVVTDEEYEKMEKDHREKVRQHHQDLARERVGKTPEEKKKEEEDFWTRLEELELEEEMQQAEEEYEKRKKQQELDSVKPTEPDSQSPSKSRKPKVAKSVSFNNTPEVREIPTKSTKVTKSVSFNNTPEIREIPSVADISEDFDNFDDDFGPDELPTVPTQEVAGISQKIVERAPPPPLLQDSSTSAIPSSGFTESLGLLLNDEIPGPSAQSVKTPFDPREAAAPPKKASLFKQRRNP